ncbi:inorganic diphosphatase [Thalassobaculum sp.]|jgi:inorganic pyrophosphatase|uniref:inorganic diphosphatase n=1 Tax=Thalassobaculum sp. TaxID=2022740 RepID=UPI003B5CFD2D
MRISHIPIGKNPPYDVNVLIEVSLGSDPVKYEFDEDSGALFVDRFLHTAMTYPCNYGFVPHTLANDGDPVDVLVVGSNPIMPKAVINVRPVGVLIMEDQEGMDEKILAVPVDKLHPYYSDVASWTDLPAILTDQIKHFFTHYKDLEVGKWVRVDRWGDAEEAMKLISEGIEAAKKKAAE